MVRARGAQRQSPVTVVDPDSNLLKFVWTNKMAVRRVQVRHMIVT